MDQCYLLGVHTVLRLEGVSCNPILSAPTIIWVLFVSGKVLILQQQLMMGIGDGKFNCEHGKVIFLNPESYM